MLTPLIAPADPSVSPSDRAGAQSRRLGALTWLLVGLVVAAILGPWLSHSLGVALPAFAMVRTGRPDQRLSLRAMARRLLKPF